MDLPKPVRFRSRFEVVQRLGEPGLRKRRETSMHPPAITIFDPLLRGWLAASRPNKGAIRNLLFIASSRRLKVTKWVSDDWPEGA
jgi:hypothetical protein